uniref:VPS9 domain-containing protein n=1 Tax=Attheya septentrionalis TaxID=420275 RepID=A0A7S2UL20_9STRA|mmetsp:Transcript_29529/g.54105  ORF Transcript_29529/g.54105 Transcript_29529/m.54105 type:complete len:630 (+) Transcript_29529:192-2081(+)
MTSSVASTAYLAVEQQGEESVTRKTTHSASSNAPTVTSDRKQALLLEARRDRLAWIHQAAHLLHAPKDPQQQEACKDGTALLQSALACSELPTVTAAVASLYGTATLVQDDQDSTGISGLTSNEVETRIQKQLENRVDKDKLDKVRVSGMVDFSESISDYISIGITKEDEDYYREFVMRLGTPECADLVYVIKSFVHHLQDAAAASSSSTNEDDIRLDRMASTIRNFSQKTYQTVLSHPLFETTLKSLTDPKQREQRIFVPLEAFVFAQCHETVWSLLSSSLENEVENEFHERVESLQFVTPHHLEITCLGDKQDAIELQDAVRALEAVHQVSSPTLKLKCMLQVFRNINLALNHGSQTASSHGADDVLPTMILTVLRTKPHGMLANLRFLQAFCTTEQLRGEAGYAFTNFYGAVQFLRDLDLTTIDTASNAALKISPEEFSAGIEKCRREAQERQAASEVKTEELMTSKDVKEEDQLSPLAMKDMDIPITEIRAARLAGAEINLAWALKWQEEHQKNMVHDRLSSAGESSGQGSGKQSKGSFPLPVGFTRSYGFLTAEPESLRLEDLPLLLQEYKMLVHTTETLLAERSARHNSENRERLRRERSKLERDASRVLLFSQDKSPKKSIQ